MKFLNQFNNVNDRPNLIHSRLALNYFRHRSFKGLRNKQFSIISNNCTAGFIYKDAGVEYLSPTIGLFFHSPCYIRLLSDFEMIKSPLQFINESKYGSANKWRSDHQKFYPIGMLAGQVEIHFLHYQSIEQAHEKWKKRLSRINPDNLLFIYSARDHASELTIRKFLALPFSNKLCLSAIDYDHKDLIFFKQFHSAGEMPPADEARINVLKKVHFAALLNNMNHLTHLSDDSKSQV